METISFSRLCVGDYFTCGNDPTLFKKAEDYQGHFSFYIINIDSETVTRSKANRVNLFSMPPDKSGW